MTPISFPEQNCVFTKPESMTDDECSSLPVFKGQWPDGSPCIVSVWQLSDEELQQVVETKQVYLSIYGHGMPPVSLFTENPFSQSNNNENGTQTSNEG